jgi:hypothetical protein
LRGHCLDDIRDRHDARLEQDRLAFQTLRVAAAVHALMVLQRDLRHRPGKLHVLQDVVARLRVPPDQRELSGVQLAGLDKNVQWDRDLADVMQVAGDSQSLLPVRIETEFRTDGDCDLRHPPFVTGGIRVAHLAQRGGDLHGVHEGGFELREMLPDLQLVP